MRNILFPKLFHKVIFNNTYYFERFRHIFKEVMKHNKTMVVHLHNVHNYVPERSKIHFKRQL